MMKESIMLDHILNWQEVGVILLLCIIAFMIGHAAGYGNAKSHAARQEEINNQSRGEVK